MGEALSGEHPGLQVMRTGRGDVRLEGRRFLVNGRRVPLIGGEVHYFRHPPELWGVLLDRALELGLSFVSTYVPWELHEVAPGEVDFTGERYSRRDLPRFLDACAARHLLVLARPGPYIYAEWRNQGVPDDVASLPKCHERYRARAAAWLRAAAVELATRQVTRGGPVALVQADNESDPAVHLHGDALGLGGRPGTFQQWLQELYGDVEALNAAWGTAHASFEEARAVLRPDLPFRRRAWHDSRDFCFHLAEENARFCLDVLREAGIEVPLLLNLWPHHDAQDWWVFSRMADLFGVDPYPADLYRGFPGEHRVHRDRLRYLRALGGLPFIAEHGAGVWRGGERETGWFHPEHYRLAVLTALAEGVAGWSWYMLADRDGWHMAPLSSRGVPDPGLWPVFKGAARVFKDLEPDRRRPAITFGATWCQAHHRELADPRLPLPDPVLEELDGLGCAFDFVDVERGTAPWPRVVFACGPSWLPRGGQQALRDHVEDGGVLVMHQALPVRDEDWRPCNLLELPLPTGSGWRDMASVEVQVGDGWVRAGGPPFRYPDGAGEPVLCRPVLPPVDEDTACQWQGVDVAPFPCGLRMRRGKGTVILLGVLPTRELLLALLAELGCTPACLPASPGIQATLLEGGDRPALLLVNPGDGPREALLHLGHPQLPDGAHTAEDLESGERLPFSVQDGRGHVPVPPRGGRALLVTPDEAARDLLPGARALAPERGVPGQAHGPSDLREQGEAPGAGPRDPHGAAGPRAARGREPPVPGGAG